MQRTFWTKAVCAVGVVLAVGTSTASADPAAFFASATGSIDDSGALVVSFDERGVGNGNIDYALTATSTAVYGCVTASGNRAKASNKEAKNGDVSGTGTFSATNGRIQDYVPAGPLPPGSFSCPKGQRMAMVSVGYSRIVLTDTTNGTQVVVPDATRAFLLG